VINEGDVVETVFSFTNSGKSELIITSAKGNCGCTVPEWPRNQLCPVRQERSKSNLILTENLIYSRNKLLW